MKFKFLIICLLAFTFSAFGQITRDFATVQALRTSNYSAKKGEKVYVTSLQNLYAVDYVDNNSTDDGYNVIIQGNRRWKCVSCHVPSKCVNQGNITVADKFNPTYTELKNYVTSQKVPNKNGAFLNYYAKNDTTGISAAYPYFELGYDSSRVTSIKINGVEKLSSPIWLYQGGNWVYVDNTLVNLFNTNKPVGVNYDVDDNDLEFSYNVVLYNITGGVFSGETTTEYYDGSGWSSYTEYFQAFYQISSGSGTCSSPLFSYLVVDSSIITIRKPDIPASTYVDGSNFLRATNNRKIRFGTVATSDNSPYLELKTQENAATLSVNNTGVTSASILAVNGPISTDLNTGKALAGGVVGEAFGRYTFYTDGKLALGPGTSTRDIVLSRSAANTFKISSNGASGVGNLEVTGTQKLGIYTVATLPNPTAGRMAFVSDALNPTWRSSVGAGGSELVLVVGNGSTWICH